MNNTGEKLQCSLKQLSPQHFKRESHIFKYWYFKCQARIE